MKYDTSNPHGSSTAFMHLTQLVTSKKIVEIKEVRPRRSLPQNAYLHLLLGYFGANLGYTLEESKYLYKRLPGNKEIYEYTKDVGGNPMSFLRSSADLSKDEMTKTIETLRDWSNRMGYPLPTATDTEALRRLENYIEQHERFL